VRKLSAIVRVADALDFRREQRVESVTCSIKKAKTLTISAAAKTSLRDEIEWAAKKGKLIKEVFNVDLVVQKTQSNRT